MLEQENKQRILDVAADKFLESGISKVTIDEVAGNLGMSKKTVYKFFPSKDELLRAIVQAIMGNMEKKIEAIVSSNRPFEAKMADFLLVLGGYAGKISRQFQVDVQRFTPNLWKEIETFRREKLLTKVNQMFLQAKEEGVFRQDLNTELFYLVFVTVVQGIVNPRVLSEHSFSFAEAFQGIFRLLFEGALTDNARRRVHFFEPSMFDQSTMRNV